MVLAPLAAEIAPERSHRKAASSWMEMNKGFLFDWRGFNSRNDPINERIEGATHINAAETVTPLTLRDKTLTITQAALN